MVLDRIEVMLATDRSLERKLNVSLQPNINHFRPKKIFQNSSQQSIMCKMRDV